MFMKKNKSINIMITNICNNTCKYCFAPIFRPKKNLNKSNFMTIEDFRYVLCFLKYSKIKNVRLLGGEPLIHPNLEEFLYEIEKEKYFKNITIFTGGIFSPKIIKYLKSNKSEIKLVLNYNHPSEYTNRKYKLLLRNIESLIDNGLKISVGYNIYQVNFDYIPLIKLCDYFGIKTLRLCIANPSIGKNTEVLDWIQRKSIGKRIYSLYMEALKKGIDIIFDCVVPPCIFTNKQWGKMTKSNPVLFYKYGICFPALDVDPSLKVFRCFSINQKFSVDLKNFKNANELFGFFYNEIDAYKWYIIDEECKHCSYIVSGICQGDCIGFKYSRIVALKKKKDIASKDFKQAYKHLKLNNYDLAIAKFEDGLKIYNYEINVICDYVHTLLKKSKVFKAQIILEEYTRVLEIDNSGISLMIKALLAESQNEFNKAITLYRKLLNVIDKSKREEILKRVRILKEHINEKDLLKFL